MCDSLCIDSHSGIELGQSNIERASGERLQPRLRSRNHLTSTVQSQQGLELRRLPLHHTFSPSVKIILITDNHQKMNCWAEIWLFDANY